MDETWADKISKIRKLKKWSQQDMGIRLGCHGGTVSAWERGLQEPNRVYQRIIEQELAKLQGAKSVGR
jgi:transcriptional regulator with XRE-family HTH domain